MGRSFIAPTLHQGSTADRTGHERKGGGYEESHTIKTLLGLLHAQTRNLAIVRIPARRVTAAWLQRLGFETCKLVGRIERITDK